MSALKKALEKADAACPCRASIVPEHCAGVTRCDCCKGSGKPCHWPGHAAIREAMRVAAEFGERWGQKLERAVVRGESLPTQLGFLLDAILGAPERKEADR